MNTTDRHAAGTVAGSAQEREVHAPFGSVLNWAIAGGVWGLMSWLIGVMAMLHIGFFDDLFERMQWLLPARWAAFVIDWVLTMLNVEPSVSERLGFPLVAIGSVALGAGGALLALCLIRWIRRALA